MIDGEALDNEDRVRRHVDNIDIEHGGEMWATISKCGEEMPSCIVKNLKDFIVESPMFKLLIPEIVC